MSAATDLAELGIDSPAIRWLAVRDYLIDWRKDQKRQVNRVYISAWFVDLAESNALKRGVKLEPGLCGCGEILDDANFGLASEHHYDYWLCDQPISRWPSVRYCDLLGNDFLQALSTLSEYFPPKFAPRLREIAKDMVFDTHVQAFL
jgi:hypothetical protein